MPEEYDETTRKGINTGTFKSAHLKLVNVVDAEAAQHEWRAFEDGNGKAQLQADLQHLAREARPALSRLLLAVCVPTLRASDLDSGDKAPALEAEPRLGSGVAFGSGLEWLQEGIPFCAKDPGGGQERDRRN